MGLHHYEIAFKYKLLKASVASKAELTSLYNLLESIHGYISSIQYVSHTFYILSPRVSILILS